jgi:hypothetical protein
LGKYRKAQIEFELRKLKTTLEIVNVRMSKTKDVWIIEHYTLVPHTLYVSDLPKALNVPGKDTIFEVQTTCVCPYKLLS